MRKAVSNSDFKEEYLPQNRREVFFDCIKIRFSVFLRCGIMLALFTLPLLASLFIGDMFSSSVVVMELNETEKASRIYSLQLFFDVVNVFCFAIMAVGFAGVMKIIRRLAFAEPLFFGYDFKCGVKSNTKTFLPIFTLFGFFVLINNYVKNVLSVYSSVICYLPWIITVIIIIPIFLYVAAQSLVYENTFLRYFAISFSLYIRTAPQAVLAAICILSPISVFFISDLIVRYAIVLVVIVFLLPMLLLGHYLYSCSVFDKLINSEKFPDLVGKGIFKLPNKKK